MAPCCSRRMASVVLEPALRGAFGECWRPCEAAATEEQLSRSKRRKLRDRQVAVRKALVSSAALKAQMQIMGRPTLRWNVMGGYCSKTCMYITRIKRNLTGLNIIKRNISFGN